MDLLPGPSYPLHLAGDNQAIDPAQIAHRLAEIYLIPNQLPFHSLLEILQ